jgi:hypothetical protein
MDEKRMREIFIDFVEKYREALLILHGLLMT